MEHKNTHEQKLLLQKLRSPLHVDYICKNIFDGNFDLCNKILEELIDFGLIDVNNDYYFLKSNINKVFGDQS